jgi:hypothetical protein
MTDVTQAHVDLAALCGFLAGCSKEGPSAMQWMLIQKRANQLFDDLARGEIIVTGSDVGPISFDELLKGSRDDRD